MKGVDYETRPDHLTFALALGTAQAADIVDTAKSAGSFNTLVTAVQAAGLVDTLKGRAVHRVRADR